MEPFGVDKSFYEIGAIDLKEIWDSDMESGVCDFKVSEDDWGSSGGLMPVRPQVIIHDRLMSDAVLGGDTPIKTEHSYCTIASDASEPGSPMMKSEIEDDDDDDDGCYLGAVAPKAAVPGGSAMEEASVPLSVVVVKTEPVDDSDTSNSSGPPSPSPPPLTPATPFIYADIKYESKTFGQSVLKPPTVVFAPKNQGIKRKHLIMQNIVKIEATSKDANFTLPPTPPSSTSSDSEGNVSPIHPSSPSRRLFLSASTTQSRQPIQTPLISSQPKGSVGTLFLTEEEKRTLLAEGYPIPVRLPLTKAEEKSLKKIRRKIKNKISAQESRRKKKEYMDALERKVQLLSSENSDYRKKITSLEDANSSLIFQLNKLQAIIARNSGVFSRNMHK